MRRRHRLGTGPTDAALNQHGVNVAAIPHLERGYELRRVGEVGIGGAAPKDFLVFPAVPALGKAYVAKQPSRKHSGFRESVTEHLIARIGHHLPIRMANTRLVRLSVSQGAPEDVRFLSQYFLRQGQQALIHGVELVAQAYGVQKSEVAEAAERNESLFYTVDMIDEVLAEVSASDGERDRQCTEIDERRLLDRIDERVEVACRRDSRERPREQPTDEDRVRKAANQQPGDAARRSAEHLSQANLAPAPVSRLHGHRDEPQHRDQQRRAGQ